MASEQDVPQTEQDVVQTEQDVVQTEQDVVQEETYSFSADISQLMSLIINTFYSNKDIFLRELISNASDALDKIRFQSLTDPTVLEDGNDFEIKLSVDGSRKLLIIEDTGIGMTKEDLVNNLGTIAKSGTKAFMEALQAGADISMIGQFGVGFYSAYLVAESVTVTSKHRDDKEYTWSSNAGGSFTVMPSSVGLKRGTRLVLQMKEGCEEFLKEATLRKLIKTHSNYIGFKISLLVLREKEEEVTDDEEEVDNDGEGKGEEEDVVEEEGKEGLVEEEEKSKEKKKKKIKVKTMEWLHLNQDKPLWLSNPADITHEEYFNFYKSMSNDWNEHIKVKHFTIEGQLDFTAILFIPSRLTTMGLFDAWENGQSNINLYVRKVFISDKCTELLPKWLSFMYGVVDSNDLPLNISRENLQQNKILKVISKTLIKKCFELFGELSEDEEEYNKFYKTFSKALKLGIHEDSDNKDKIIKFLRFRTNKSGEDYMSLDNYVKNMHETQKSIYYAIGTSIEELKLSPFVEILNKKGIECLLMDQPIDEYIIQKLPVYQTKKLINVATEDFELEMSTEEKKQTEQEEEHMKILCNKIKDILGDKVDKVVVSKRIVDSPCCLVTPKFGYTANMQRILKYQVLDSGFGGINKQIMEINASHSIIKRLRARVFDKNSTKMFADLVWLLYETTVLTSGFSLVKPTLFASRIHKLIDLGLADDDDDDDDEDNNVEKETLNDEKNINLSVNDDVTEMEQVD